MQILLPAVLALAPLLMLPGLIFYYDVTPKVVVVLIGAALGLVFSGKAFLTRGARRLWASPAGHWFSWLVAAQLLFLLLSTLLSTHPALSWNGTSWRRLGFIPYSGLLLFSLLAAASISRAWLPIVLRAVAAAGIPIACYGILQYFGVDPWLPASGYLAGEGPFTIVRPPATLGHALYFSTYLLYVVFFGAALVATEARRTWKYLGGAAVVIGSAAIVLSGARAAWLGWVVGALLVAIQLRPVMNRARAVVAVGACAALLVFYLAPSGARMRARVHWALDDLRGGARLWLWRDSLRMARARWLTGYGPETFGVDFPKFQSVELSRVYPDFYHESPHNIFADALASQGIAGPAILLGFLVVAWMAVKRAPEQNRAAAFLGAALAAAVASEQFACFTMPTALYFYTTIALLAGLGAPDPDTRHERSLSLGWVAYAAGSMAAFLFCVFAVRLAFADWALARVRSDLDAGRVEAAISHYAQASRWQPSGASADLYYSRRMAIAARAAKQPAQGVLAAQQAFSAARNAPETSESPQNAFYNLAAFYAVRNDAAGVETCLRSAIASSPNWFKPHWALAQALALSARREEAVREAARAVELSGGKYPEVTRFLQNGSDSHNPDARE